MNEQISPQDLDSIDKRMKKRMKSVKPKPRWGEGKRLHGADELWWRRMNEMKHIDRTADENARALWRELHATELHSESHLSTLISILSDLSQM